MMEARGLIEKVEDHVHTVPHGDRSDVPIEPFLTDQWYVDAKTLAEPAIAAVRDGRTVFVPKNWEKTYFDWMENIQPWCISRQLWWGHQIPAWYGPDGKVFVAATRAKRRQARCDYAEATEPGMGKADRRAHGATRTCSTPGSRRRSGRSRPSAGRTRRPSSPRYYPTSTLVTGFDIIFFWVARMMMMGLHFMKEEPFRDVYIHALVRDEKGAKMSKSKGNVIDPLGLIDDYGADALRFTLAAMAAQGRDIKLSPARVEGYRNFATKLWNAASFAELYDCKPVAGFDPAAANEILNRWIATETTRAAAGGHRGDRGLQVQRSRRRRLSFRLEPDLRLVPGADQAGPERRRRAGQGRDARHRRLGARPHRSRCSTRSCRSSPRSCGRGAGDGRSASAARPLPTWPTLDFRGRSGRRRDQLADRADHRRPLGALGDERAARRRWCRSTVSARRSQDRRSACRPTRR